MNSLQVRHWMVLLGASLSVWRVLRVCLFPWVRHFVLAGDSWTFEYRRRKHSEVFVARRSPKA
jgi:hypothetical protein